MFKNDLHHNVKDNLFHISTNILAFVPVYWLARGTKRPVSLPPVIAFFDDTSWRSSATALLVKLGLFSSLRRSKSVTTCSRIFYPLTVSAEMSPLDFTARHLNVSWLGCNFFLSFLPLLLFCVFQNHLDKLYTCLDGDPPSVHVDLLISSIRLPHFHRKKGGQLTTVTYFSQLSTPKQFK